MQNWISMLYICSVTLQEYCMFCMHVLENHLPIVKMPGLPLWEFFSTQWRNWKAWHRRPWREIERGRIFEARTHRPRPMEWAVGVTELYPSTAHPSGWRSYVAFRRHGTVFITFSLKKRHWKSLRLIAIFATHSNMYSILKNKQTLLMTQISFWCFMRLEWTKFIECLSIYPTEGFCVFDFGI
jgi:hypothetical protein